ncbi:MAG: acylneuraminate cytidylyltransferase [Magnetococcales bacterium]|nr:acylneuraminate cytidylyltransferase [Magnetococcales bacterium]
MKLLAIIPARCGAKGSTNRFLQDLGGRPLLAWTVEHALNCPAVTRTVVLTDQEEIAQSARLAGAEVPILIPAALAKEGVSLEAALAPLMEEFAKREFFKPDAIMILSPTTPLRSPGRVTAAVWQFQAEGADSLVSVCAQPQLFWTNPRNPRPGFDPRLRTRIQEMGEAERSYRENGSITIARGELLRENKSLVGGKVTLFQMDEKESQEIDTLLNCRPSQEWRCERIGPEPMRGSPLAWMDAVVFDFDGVLTDNRVLVNQDGIESVLCSRGDGMGFDILRAAGIPAFIMSTETNPVVSARARKLKLPVFQAVRDKGVALETLCREHGFKPERIIFVGNDINDLPAMKIAGFPVAVADAQAVVRKAAWRVLKTPGGFGIVRELIEGILGLPDALPGA